MRIFYVCDKKNNYHNEFNVFRNKRTERKIEMLNSSNWKIVFSEETNRWYFSLFKIVRINYMY